MTFKKKILKNGLRIIVVPVKGAASATVMALVEAGSEYEAKNINGLSHFLEHMFFKGTIKRPSSIDIAKEFDGLGAYNNAFTSNEFTGYYGKAHPKHVDNMLDIISDMYLNPQFPDAELQKEKGVIIEEINMYEDLPQYKVKEVFAELLYGDTPYGWSIAGPKENIIAMQRDDFVTYKNTHYIAEKTVVLAAGDINVNDFFKKVEKAFKNIPTGKQVVKKKVSEKQVVPALKIKHKDTDQVHLVLGVRSFNVKDKRNSTLQLLSVLLGGNMSSRLFQKMREELGICYYVRSEMNRFTDHGNFTVSAGVDTKRVGVAVEGILGEMKKMMNEKVTADELAKAKEYMIGTLYLGLESSDSVVEFYGEQEIMRQDIKNPKDIEKEIRKITADDIQKLAKQLFKNSSLNMAMIGNVTNEAELKRMLHF